MKKCFHFQGLSNSNRFELANCLNRNGFRAMDHVCRRSRRSNGEDNFKLLTSRIFASRRVRFTELDLILIDCQNWKSFLIDSRSNTKAKLKFTVNFKFWSLERSKVIWCCSESFNSPMQITWLRTFGGRWHDSAGYKNVRKRKRTNLIIAWLANEVLAISIWMISISENKFASEWAESFASSFAVFVWL